MREDALEWVKEQEDRRERLQRIVLVAAIAAALGSASFRLGATVEVGDMGPLVLSASFSSSSSSWPCSVGSNRACPLPWASAAD
jgi:hypothetical protein